MPATTLEPLLPAAPARAATTRRVAIADVVVGGPRIAVIAGPCSVEPAYPAQAAAVAAAGASLLRGCVLKPRTRPGTFQGLGGDALPLLDEARRSTGLGVLSEPLQPADVALLGPHVDALLIGARSMQNVPLLREAGGSGLPVVLKRGLAATIDEWLGAAEHVRDAGGEDIVLCERGIRTFETATRNTLDVSAIPVCRERSGLPVIVDPSHAAGQARWVPALALAAIAAGADGLLLECHPDPAASWSDAAQAITPEVLATIMAAVEVLAPLVREPGVAGLAECRSAIDGVDGALARLLDRRAHLVECTQAHKRRGGAATRDRDRERAVVARVAARAPRLRRDGVEAVMAAVVEASLGACATAAVF